MGKVHELVARGAALVWRLLSILLIPLKWLLGSWQPPHWLAWLGQKTAPLGRWAATHAAYALLAVLVAFGALATPRLMHVDWRAKLASLASVQPDVGQKTVTGITVTRPERTPVEGDGKPRPLVLTFSASAAPLARVGKEAQDVSISPALAGHWMWVEANRLEFTPTDDWPIAVEYTVTLGSKALAPHVEVGRELTFSSPRFEMKIGDASFYQDPVQFTLRKAVFNVTFTQPVNPEVFEKRVTLVSDSAAASLFVHPADAQKVTVTFDKFRLQATVISEAMAIPATTTGVTLSIASGVTAQRGGNATPTDQVMALSIPGLYSLDIVELKQMIVTGDSGEPENILQITSGMPVQEKEMARVTAAWLLPEKKADSDEPWSDAADVTEDVLKKSKRIALQTVPSERETTDIHAFKFAAEPGRFLFVRIAKGLKSAGGYELGATRDEIFRIKRSAPELAIMSKGSLLALSGDKKLPLVVRDLPGVRIELGRLLPQQLQHLVTQSQGDMSQPQFYGGITPDSLTERFEKKLPLNLRPGKTHYETVDFSEYLKADVADRRGVFLLTVQGYDPKNANASDLDQQPDQQGYDGEGDGDGGQGEAGDDEDKVDPTKMLERRLVIVTDLGIISKSAVDGSRDVFVQSIANGQPVGGANVEVWGRNGSVLVSQNTDASGQAHLPSMTGFVREKLPVVLVVKKAGDLSFLPLNRDRSLDLSRFDISGLHSSGLPNQIQAYLFSDRGIYRPGDSINVGIVAKSQGWTQKLADLPVEMEVTDARGLVVRREKLRLGPGGMAEFTHATEESSPTGNMTFNLNLARDTGSAAPGAAETPPLLLGSVSVKVQEFLPDRMKVAAHLSPETDEGWVAPADLKALINVQNLFGTAAPKRRVDAHLTLTPAYPAFRSYSDYQFYDPQHAKEKFDDELAKSETDDKGNAEIVLGLQRYAQATYQMRLVVNAFEPEGGRSVAAEVSTLVSDRPYLIGYKADGDLGYVNKGSVRNVAFVAIDPKAHKTTVNGLKLVRIERRVVSVLMKQPNGLFKYESRPKETVLNEEAYNLPATGAKLPLATQTPGNFAYAIRDANGLELVRVEYSVAGNGNVSRSLDRNAELQLALNRKDYNPGDEIEISIRAPYAGAGLITIERDHVVASKWFKTIDTASTQKIVLPKEFEGNGYVSVQFARDLASDEIYMSPMSYGVVPFVTSQARRTNPVVLHAPELVKPGQAVKFTLESKAPTRAVVFAVDEGILQVARYKLPDPLKFFFQKRALEVTTQQTMDLILPEFAKLMRGAAPGGDADGAIGKNLNPFKRKRDKPVVFWSGVVDVNGVREFNYTVPESFNGSLRVMAVAVNDDTAASAMASTTVRGDLVLLPNVPVAITPGDEVEIGVGVSNNARGSGKDAAVSLGLAVTGGLEVVGAAQQALKISENSEGSTKFLVRAKPGAQAQLGSASVIFTAQTGKGGEAKARLSTDVSVRPASAYVTLVQSGTFKGSGVIKSQADMYPNFQRSQAAVSASPWAFASGLAEYLDVYPYGCTEQITSQTLPAVVIGTQPGVAEELLKRQRNMSGADKDIDKAPPDPRKTFQRYLALVRARQTAEGGFAMWPGGGQADLFATTYVVNLLVEAKERKLPVPNDMLQRANVYLQGRVGQGLQDDWQWRTATEAAYLLTRQGVMTTAVLTNLRESLRTRMQKAGNESMRNWWRNDMGAAYLAASFQLLKQDDVANELIQPVFNNAIVSQPYWNNWYWNYYYDPLVSRAATIQLVARHFPKLLKDVPVSYWENMSKAVNDGWFETHSAATMILSIDAYASAAAQSAAGKIDIGAIDRKGVQKALELPAQFKIAKVGVPTDTAGLKLTNGGDLPLFYSWSESGYERNLPTEAKSSGMEIIHEFLDAKGNPISEAEVGDEITVRVRVRGTDPKRYNVQQVALVDVLPGGMEPVLNSPSDTDDADTPLWRRRLGGKSTWQIQYADIREDRVIFFGDVGNSLTEVTYKVKATNVGTFVVPSAYGEAMYERRIYARSAASAFKIKPVSK